jgi:D-alanine transaminase
MICYLNGSFLSKADLRISPDDRGFLFGDGVYEVVCSYGGRLFKEHEHMQRLKRSLHEMRIDFRGVDNLITVGLELLKRNNMSASFATLYFQVTRGVAPRRHSFPAPDTSPTVYATVYPYELPLEKWNHGVIAILHPDLRWDRCDIKTISLVPNILANQAAQEAGAFEALLVRNDHVTEGTHTSFGAVIEGKLWTHPLTPRLLPGITRSIVLDICRKEGIPVHEEPVPVDRLAGASEMMLFATTLAVTPIIRLGEAAVGNGRPGPLAQRLLAAFRQYAHI